MSEVSVSCQENNQYTVQIEPHTNGQKEMAAARLVDIASLFNLGDAGSVSFITHQIRKRKKEDRHLASRINSIVESIMKKAT